MLRALFILTACLAATSAYAAVTGYHCHTDGPAWSNTQRYAGDPRATNTHEFNLFVENGVVTQLDDSKLLTLSEYGDFAKYSDRGNEVNLSSPPLLAIQGNPGADAEDVDSYQELQFASPNLAESGLQGVYYEKAATEYHRPLFVPGLYGADPTSSLSARTFHFVCVPQEGLARPTLAGPGDTASAPSPALVTGPSCANATAATAAKNQLLDEMNAKSQELSRLAFTSFRGVNKAYHGIADGFASRVKSLLACLPDDTDQARAAKTEFDSEAKGLLHDIRSVEELSQSVFGN